MIAPFIMDDSISTYEQDRRAKRDKLRELGHDPYGGRVEGVTRLSDIRALHKPEFGQDGGPVVKGAGRIMLKRDMGKLSFLTIRDESGDLQVALDKKRVGESAWPVNELLDLGDQIVIEGPLGTTKKGEITVWATSFTLASKALLPPPAKWEGLSDVEARYRQRYVDLWANPEVMKLAHLRIRIVDEMRAFLRGRGYVEVETPMMQVLHGGAAAKPFKTHHNALNMELFLRIAPELYLKRLLVGGFSKVFEINRNFRNEGISPRHNPEFTMLEAYEAFGSFETMAEMVESLICTVAKMTYAERKAIAPALEHPLRIKHANGREINLEGDLTKPAGQRWRRVRMADLVAEETERLGLRWDFDNESVLLKCPQLVQFLMAKPIATVKKVITRDGYLSTDEKDATAAAQNALDMLKGNLIAHLAKMSPAEQLVEVYEKLIEPTLIDPTFVTHVPSVIIPLARENRADPFFADVYELAINGQEISPGYSELNDPDKQREHFMHQVGEAEEQQKVDEDFLTALKYGMPPAGGMGLGVDRLIMMLTGAESIRDVILFPLMRPQ